jgi:hypothetical protein
MTSVKYKLVDTLRSKHIKTNLGLGYIVNAARKEVYKDKNLNKSKAAYYADRKRKKRIQKIFYRENKEACLLNNKLWRLANLERDNLIKKKSALKKKYKIAMQEVYKHNRTMKRIEDQIERLKLKQMKGNNER